MSIGAKFLHNSLTIMPAQMTNQRKGGLTVVITGGGTGGHIFPGIAVAQEICGRDLLTRVVFIGTERKMDKQAMQIYGFETETIRCMALKGKGILAKLKALMLLPVSLVESVVLLRKIHPHLVCGVGGYVTGPVLLAAKILGISTCIHEQNSIPGMANRKLGPLVDRIFVSLPGSERFFPAKKCLLSGNPLRDDILRLAKEKRGPQNPTLIVLGGSQGAHSINQVVPKALAIIADRLPEGFKVIHQTGAADEKAVNQAYKEIGVSAKVADFFSNMSEVYREATVVLSRAGATTLAELTALRLPMILIPYPYAADDHQKKNAQALVEKGAAAMFLEAELSAASLSAELIGIFDDDQKRRAMSAACARFARPDAAKIIVDECLQMIATKGQLQ